MLIGENANKAQATEDPPEADTYFALGGWQATTDGNWLASGQA